MHGRLRVCLVHVRHSQTLRGAVGLRAFQRIINTRRAERRTPIDPARCCSNDGGRTGGGLRLRCGCGRDGGRGSGGVCNRGYGVSCSGGEEENEGRVNDSQMLTGAQLSFIPAEGRRPHPVLPRRPASKDKPVAVTWCRAAHHSLITAARQLAPRFISNRRRKRIKRRQFLSRRANAIMCLRAAEAEGRGRFVGGVEPLAVPLGPGE